MKKLNFLTLLLALLVSSSVWAWVSSAPNLPNLNFEKTYLDGKPDLKQVTDFLSTKYPDSHLIGKSLAPTRKIAQSVVAYIGAKSYDSWDSAYADAADGDTIRLNQNLSQHIVLSKNIVLDLNDKYVYTKTNQYVIFINANVTIMNGKILTFADTYYDDKDVQIADSKTYAVYMKGGTAIFNDVTISATDGYPYNALYLYSGTAVVSNSTLYGADAAITNVGDLVINDGSRISGADGVDVFGAGSVSILDSSYVYGYYYGMYVSSSGDIEIGGSAILETDLYYALYLSASGTSNITIKGNSKIKYNGSSLAIYIKGSGTVNIRDNAHIVSPNRICLCQLDAGVINVYSGTLETVGRCIQGSSTINVYGGYFKASRFKSNGVTPMNAIESYGSCTIIGGTFVNKVVAVTSGYDYYDNGDDTYTVKKIVAHIVGSDVNYFSIADAVKAASANDEIVLVADVTEDVTINKSVTLNTNGKTITGNIQAAGSAVVSIIDMGIITGTLSETDDAQIIAYEGKYAINPSDFVSEESTLKFTSPYYVVTRAAVRVNGVDYVTFAEAVAAAESIGNNPTIELLADAKLKSNACQNISTSLVVDLNGHTLFAGNNENSYVNLGSNGTVVTIKNGTMANVVTATLYPQQILAQTASNTLNLVDVNIENKGQEAINISSDGANCNIDNECVISGNKTGVKLSGNSTLTNNADIKVGVQDKNATIINNQDASISLTSFGTYDKALSITNSGDFEIISGVYNGSFALQSGSIDMVIRGGVFYPDTKEAVEAYKANDKVWNAIKYKGESVFNLYTSGQQPVAIVDGQNYFDLQDAISAIAENGVEKTIILQEDIDVEVLSPAAFTIVENQYIKLDLNGKVINATNATIADVMAAVFNVVAGSQLTIEDNSISKLGRITYKNTCNGGWTVYTINCNGVLVINGGTIENTSTIGIAPYVIELGKAGKLTINGGLVWSHDNLAIRYWADESDATVLNINGGEVKGKLRALWIQLPSSDPTSSPYAVVNITGGKLTCENKEAFYVYTYGQSLDNITINVSGGEINGRFLIGGGALSGGNYNENILISGGTFNTSNAYESFKRGVEHKSVTGGAFYFGPDEPSSNYIKFCEYIVSGHYALKMIQDDEHGTFPEEGTLYGHKYSEGVYADSSFWAVIDGVGKKVPQTTSVIGDWSAGTGGVFIGDVPDEMTDVQIAANSVVTVQDGVVAEANRLIVENGAGIIVKNGAVLNVGVGGIEVVGDGVGTTYVIVEPEGTLISNGTVVSTDVKDIIIEADKENGAGSYIVSPDVTINQQPQATVEMKAIIGKQGGDYTWHRFAMPVLALENAWMKDPNIGTYLYGWDYNNKDWKNMAGSTNMERFQGYAVTTDEITPQEVKFTFKGQLVGNVASDIDFTKVGYGYFGNSYTGYILAKTMLEDLVGIPGIVGSVWMWKSSEQKYSGVSLQDLIEDIDLEDYEREVAPMQTFILKSNSGEGATIDIDYASAIWGNPRYDELKGLTAPVRKQRISDNDAFARIIVTSASGISDHVRLTENNTYSDQYENGFDATKYMNENAFNLYCTVEDEDYTSLYTDNLMGKKLTLQTQRDVNYTLSFGHIEGDDYALVDLLTNAIVPMTEGETYNFTAQPNSTEVRFQIINAHKMPTDIESLKTTKMSRGIYTMMGQYIGETYNWDMMPSGVYVVNGVKLVK